MTIARMPRSEIIQGDCLQVISSMPDESVDCMVTDPPYCSGSVGESQRTAAKSQGIKTFGWFVGDNMGTAGLAFLLRSIAFEAVRVVRPTGSVLVFCDWRMVPNIAPAIESSGLRYQNMIVWDKKTPGMGNSFRAQHEIVLHFTNGVPRYYHGSAGNVLSVKRTKHQTRVHQTEKPIALMQALLKVVCPPGGVALDPFGGSGTTAVAAEGIGRHAICIERDAAHVETACDRLANVQETLL